MNDYLISMFIDNELNIEEKIFFVETVHGNRGFKNDTVDLLNQEKLIRKEVVAYVPAVRFKKKRKLSLVRLRPLALFGAGLAAAMLVFFFSNFKDNDFSRIPYRFVIYQPDVSRVEIAGTFTEWNSLPMQKMGASGYWETVLELPLGEHRYSFILEGQQKVPDPTILIRENDDFGGENSILRVSFKA
jgi:hypothetical protein